jgi:zinc transporter 1
MAHKPVMSRSARITLLLVIDVVFFFVELIVGKYICFVGSQFIYLLVAGYAVGSLALVADSFHMLKCVFIPCLNKSWLSCFEQ